MKNLSERSDNLLWHSIEGMVLLKKFDIFLRGSNRMLEGVVYSVEQVQSGLENLERHFQEGFPFKTKNYLFQLL